MTKQDYILLFEKMFPQFFERDYICNLPDEAVFDEMLLKLKEFNPDKYDKNFNDSVSFGFYEGDLEELRQAVESVDENWTGFYNEDTRVYCGYVERKIASFCIVEDKGEFDGSVK